MESPLCFYLTMDYIQIINKVGFMVQRINLKSCRKKNEDIFVMAYHCADQISI